MAWLDGKQLHFLTCDGRVKRALLPAVRGNDDMRRHFWILKNVILVLYGDWLFFVNKETLKASKFALPKLSDRDDKPQEISYHFVPTKGVMMRILVGGENYDKFCEGLFKDAYENLDFSVWLGQISIEHRQETEWQGNFKESSFVHNTDGRSYFARVDSLLPYTKDAQAHYFRDAAITFSEDGSVLMIIGRELTTWLCVIGMDRENTGLLWRTEVTGELLKFNGDDHENRHTLARANSRFLFLIHCGRITIKDIKDGTDIRDVDILPREEIFMDSMPAWNLYLSQPHPPGGKFFVSEKYFIVLKQKYEDEGNAIIEREFAMLDLDTFETKCLPIREWLEPGTLSDSEEPYETNFRIFHDGQLAVFTLHYINTDVRIHYHFDLSAPNLDKLCDGSREINSTVKCYDEFVVGYERVREMGRGAYMLIANESSPFVGRRRARQTNRYAWRFSFALQISQISYHSDETIIMSIFFLSIE